MAEVAKMAPGFGGLFLDQNASRFNIYLLEPRTKDAAIAAIADVFGAKRFPKEVRVLVGQYDYEELLAWDERMTPVFAVPGVSTLGIDEGRNRLLIGLKREIARSEVEVALNLVDVSRAAVIIEVTGPITPLDRLTDRIRPTVGGLQIDDLDRSFVLSVSTSRGT